jgi:hypothetical protein
LRPKTGAPPALKQKRREHDDSTGVIQAWAKGPSRDILVQVFGREKSMTYNNDVPPDFKSKPRPNRA